MSECMEEGARGLQTCVGFYKNPMQPPDAPTPEVKIEMHGRRWTRIRRLRAILSQI